MRKATSSPHGSIDRDNSRDKLGALIRKFIIAEARSSASAFPKISGMYYNREECKQKT